ncbi:MAG: hypothetical protein CL674_01040 [Bdellovibrionaceae bacterium]|nr:hypothetical protein [Pseudobdellovibrionaceae bacterium]|tara:strand:+ start:15505 stop:16068 length:564 start_codon:yes stop_codon:yes gene_type:complete
MTNKVKNIIHTSYPGIAKNIFIVALLVLLVMTYQEARKNKREVITIYVGENETRLITSEKDPILQKEVVNFVKDFIANYYSYSNDDIKERMGLATDLMSDDLFKKSRDKINEGITKIELRDFIQQARLRKLTKEDNGEYRAVIDIRGKEKLNKFEAKYELNFIIKRAERTKRNKYGLEVAYVKESRI